MKITKNSIAMMMLALGLGTLSGCISFGGKAVAPLPGASGNDAPPLTATEISDKALEAEKRRKIKTEAGVVFTFQRKVVINEIKGKKERLKTRTYQSYSDHRDPVLLLIDGKKPTPEQVEKERKEIHKHQIKIMGSGKSKEDPDREGDANLMVRNIEKHRDKFIPHLIGTETINGRPAYILQFLHDPEKRFKEAMANEVLKHVLIKIWIDQKEFQVAKAEVVLANPLYVIGGLAATVTTFKLTAYQKRLTPEIWTDHRVTTFIEGRVLWTPHTITFSSESSDFKPVLKND
ncbi:MAG TPA: hypothetical protein EYQ62_05765 [Verrucomicrobiales bacterium]|jgi:hypothetical protein|nr:hypothetical protein [Verrucomicrobiales bacterium]HIL25468.1 hypothetical protein [Verrucomicrobiota bacterium]